MSLAVGLSQEGLLDLQTPRIFTPLLADVRYKGAKGGRGSGKSHHFAEDAVVNSVMLPGYRLACIREVQRSLQQSVKLLIEDKIRSLRLGHYFHVTDEKITSRGGGLIIFQGMQNHTADSIKSLEGFDAAWVEEAQSLSERSLSLLRPTIRGRGIHGTRRQLWFSWNPTSPKDPVEKFFTNLLGTTAGRATRLGQNAALVHVNWRDNPFFPDDLREEMEFDRFHDKDKFAHVWLGQYQIHSSARVFKNYQIHRFVTPANARLMFGCDWGFSVDPTVLIRCYAIGRDLFFDREAWRVGCEIDHTPALFAGDDTRRPARWQNPYGFRGVKGSMTWPLIADSSDPQNISYMRRMGFENMRGSIKGPNSVEQGIEFLKSFNIHIHEDECPNTGDEFATYSYKVDAKTEEVLPILDDDKNHTIDSGRYAVEPLRRGSGLPVIGRY